MSGYALMLTGRSLHALVVGGGEVATRKVRAMVGAVARVRVVAPATTTELDSLSAELPQIVVIERRAYEPGDVGDADIVFAATDVRAVNARVASDARAMRRLVNVADAAEEGSFVTPAQGGEPPLRVAVSALVPEISRRVLDEALARFDARYARAAAAVSALRARLLRAGAREEWARARAELLGEDFCASVEDGRFETRMAAWG